MTDDEEQIVNDAFQMIGTAISRIDGRAILTLRWMRSVMPSTGLNLICWSPRNNLPPTRLAMCWLHF